MSLAVIGSVEGQLTSCKCTEESEARAYTGKPTLMHLKHRLFTPVVGTKRFNAPNALLMAAVVADTATRGFINGAPAITRKGCRCTDEKRHTRFDVVL